MRPARVIDVLEEQFEFLTSHYRELLNNPAACAGPRGQVCSSCLRFLRLKDVLLKPFDISTHKQKAA